MQGVELVAGERKGKKGELTNFVYLCLNYLFFLFRWIRSLDTLLKSPVEEVFKFRSGSHCNVHFVGKKDNQVVLSLFSSKRYYPYPCAALLRTAISLAPILTLAKQKRFLRMRDFSAKKKR